MKKLTTMLQTVSKELLLAVAVLLLAGSGAFLVANSKVKPTNVGKPPTSQAGTTLSAEKTAEGYWYEEYGWSVKKTVAPNRWDLFSGDSGTSEYGIKITKTPKVKGGPGVKGTIYVYNGGDVATEGLKIEDVVQYKIGSGKFTDWKTCEVDISEKEVLRPMEGHYYKYDCKFDPVPGATAYRNTARVTITNHSGYLDEPFGPAFGGEGVKADFTLPDEPTLINNEVKAVDSMEGELGTFYEDKTITYPKTFICDADEGEKVNTVILFGDNDVELDKDSAKVEVNCYDLSVTKDAAASYTRTWNWDIDKTVNPQTISMFAGETHDADYKVSVDKTGYKDSDWMVEGKITITNPAPIDAEIKDVSDIVSEDIVANVECNVDFPYILEKGEELVCDYKASLPNSENRINTATVELQNYKYHYEDDPVKSGTKKFTGTANVIFGEPTEVYNEVTVTDTNWEEGVTKSANDDTSWDYTKKLTCPTDKTLYTNGYHSFKHENTATIVETGQTADATVTVNCYMISVAKTANTAYTRTWTWDIKKTGDQTSLELDLNESGMVNYTVTVDATHKDSKHNFSGKITIHNPAPIDAVINDIKDMFIYNDSWMEIDLDCGEFDGTIAAGGSLICDYSKNLEGAINGTNKVNVYQEKNTYDSEGVATPIEGEGDLYSAMADVDFTEATVTKVDKKVYVDDDQYGSLGKVYGWNTPKVFNYSLKVGPYEVCGEYQFKNIAKFTTNDTKTTGEDYWVVDVSIVCNQWCSPGYWRQTQHLDSWEATGYSPDDLFYDALGYYPILSAKGMMDGAPTNPTLWDVLQNPEWYGGDAFNAVGDLLSAAHPDVSFGGERVENSCPLN